MNKNIYIKLKEQYGGKKITITFTCINKDDIPKEIITAINKNKDLNQYDSTDKILIINNKLNHFLQKYQYKIDTLDNGFEALEYDKIIEDYTANSEFSLNYSLKKINVELLRREQLEKDRLFITNLEDKIVDVVRDSKKEPLILLCYLSGNINQSDIEKNFLQSLNINAIRTANAENLSLVIINIDKIFITNEFSEIQFNNILNMRLVSNNNMIYDYQLNEPKPIIENEYIEYLKHNLGSEWYYILKNIDLRLINVGIELSSQLMEELENNTTFISYLKSSIINKIQKPFYIYFKFFLEDFTFFIRSESNLTDTTTSVAAATTLSTITYDDESAIKYIKYKIKYLQLKNKLNSNHQ
jgi:hypothetical protein